MAGHTALPEAVAALSVRTLVSRSQPTAMAPQTPCSVARASAPRRSS